MVKIIIKTIKINKYFSKFFCHYLLCTPSFFVIITRNVIIFGFHPSAQNCSIRAGEILAKLGFTKKDIGSKELANKIKANNSCCIDYITIACTQAIVVLF